MNDIPTLINAAILSREKDNIMLLYNSNDKTTPGKDVVCVLSIELLVGKTISLDELGPLRNVNNAAPGIPVGPVGP